MSTGISRARAVSGRRWGACGHRPRPLPRVLLLVLLATCDGPPPATGNGAEYRGRLVAAAQQRLELAADSRHHFSVQLETGSLLDVKAEQDGIDVILALLPPGASEPALEVDQEKGWKGREALLWTADTSGEHIVEIRARQAEASSGHYRITLAVPRSVVRRDRYVVSALLELDAARRLALEGGETSRRRALERYDSALSKWRRVGDARGEANTLMAMSEVHFDLGERQRALEELQAAKERWLEQQDVRGLAATLNLIGYVHRRLGELAAAGTAYEAALEYWQQAEDVHGTLRTLNNLGILDQSQGDHEAALRRLEQVAELRESLGDLHGLVQTQVDIGRIASHTGELARAEQALRNAVELATRVGDAEMKGAALSSLGLVKVRAGALQEALGYYREALEQQLQLDDSEASAHTANNLGRLYQRLGDEEQALARYRQALTLAGSDIESRALALTFLGGLRLATGRPDLARVHLQKGYEQAVAVDATATAVLASRGLADLYAAAEDWPTALRHLETALELERGRRNPDSESWILDRLAAVHLALGQAEQAERAIRRALRLQRRLGSGHGESLLLLTRSTLERRRGDRYAALATLRQAVDLVERTRSGLWSLEHRASFLGTQDRIFEDLVQLLMELEALAPERGHLEEAFAVSERVRARSLLDELEAAETGTRSGETRALRASINALEFRRTQLVMKGQGEGEEALQEVKRQLDRLFARYEEHRGALDRRAGATEPLSLAAIRRQVLAGDELLLQYFLGERRSFLFAVTARGIDGYELPPRSTVEAAALRAYAHLVARNRPAEGESYDARSTRVQRADATWRRDAEELSRMLLAPAAGRLEEHRLLVVADGALQQIPFHALPDPRAPEQPLLVRHSLVWLPSASVGGTLRRRASEIEELSAIAVFADPVYDSDDDRMPPRWPWRFGTKDTKTPASDSWDQLRSAQRDLGVLSFPRLRFSGREAEVISELAGRGDVLRAVDFDASRETLEDAGLSRFRIVHFASHALLHDRRPELSGIVLSLVDERGRPRDGFLRQHDIQDLKLQADLVVLSACRTALGRDLWGEGLVGLPRAFLYAGAQRVVASLWSVGDRSTFELMQRLYRSVLEEGKTPAAALREAQIAMWRQGEADYYWAGFVLQGEWD